MRLLIIVFALASSAMLIGQDAFGVAFEGDMSDFKRAEIIVDSGVDKKIIHKEEKSEKVSISKSLKKIDGEKVSYELIHFKKDQSGVQKKYENRLLRLRSLMAKRPNLKVEIFGFTRIDESLAHDYCDKLSMERAESVAKFLMKSGVAFERIRCEGYGRRKVDYSPHQLKIRKLNQCVEVHVYEPKS